ncbi:class I SAM-dependent methyltransferase [Micromonospora sp. DT31]|uniref:class I SAM-dependent methyltransferase n=1 Tax=Micromonospora sp. DT31 TaxID=3393434 RepID=UPI003CF246AE
MSSSAPDYDHVAPYYDDLTSSLLDTGQTVDFLAEHAGAGRILELGVGTGRIARPLSQRGYDVTGMDNSPGMLARLRSRADGAKVNVVLGSFTEMPVEGNFDLIYAVFNSLFCALTQEEQLRTVQLAAQHLAVDGMLVVETNLPDIARSDSAGRTLNTGGVERNRVFIEAAMHDPSTQRIRTQTIIVSEQGIQMFPVMMRYFWPSELDLMARLAGLRLVKRYGNWDKSPYNRTSNRQISVFQHDSRQA